MSIVTQVMTAVTMIDPVTISVMTPAEHALLCRSGP